MVLLKQSADSGSSLPFSESKKKRQISVYQYPGAQQASGKSELMDFQPITSLVNRLFSGNGNVVFTELYLSFNKKSIPTVELSALT